MRVPLMSKCILIQCLVDGLTLNGEYGIATTHSVAPPEVGHEAPVLPKVRRNGFSEDEVTGGHRSIHFLRRNDPTIAAFQIYQSRGVHLPRKLKRVRSSFRVLRSTGEVGGGVLDNSYIHRPSNQVHSWKWNTRCGKGLSVQW